MQLQRTPEEAAFADELRAWLGTVLPSLPPKPDPYDWDGRRAYDTGWQRVLFDAGYAGISWPVEYGGRGASPAEELIYMEEMHAAGAPYVGVNFVGQLHAGRTVMAEGTPAQKARYLPAILRGDEVWCQGFSEPGAGSDLASLRTRAIRDGDEYVINGQKVWSTYAQVADYGEVLVRTDPDAPKHKGISWVIIPMKSAGITIRPIRTVAGPSEFCEVFYDEVRIPVANRVGDENDGWRVAMVTFGFERGTAFLVEIMEGYKLARRVAEVAGPSYAATLGRLIADFDALWSMTAWNVAEATRTGVPGPGASLLKLRVTEAFQELAAVGMRAMGPDGWAQGNPIVDEYLRGLSFTIGGGTSQIQRNIVAERLLGLPKEPPWTSS